MTNKKSIHISARIDQITFAKLKSKLTANNDTPSDLIKRTVHNYLTLDPKEFDKEKIYLDQIEKLQKSCLDLKDEIKEKEKQIDRAFGFAGAEPKIQKLIKLILSNHPEVVEKNFEPASIDLLKRFAYKNF